MGQCVSNVAAAKEAAGASSPNRQNEALEAVRALDGTRGLSTEVELSLSASKLRDRDALSKSDPIVVGYVKNANGGRTEFGRTELVLNSLNPVWVTQLSIVYKFEEVQGLRFIVYDVDTKLKGMSTKSLKLEEQQFLGQIDVFLAEIFRAPRRSITKPLQDKQGSTRASHCLGDLTIKAEEMQGAKSLVSIRARCSKLTNMEQFSKSDPFLRLSRISNSGILPVYKTEVKRNNLNPEWNPIKITLQQLCTGDLDRPIKIECFDFNSNGHHVLIGYTDASIGALQTQGDWDLYQDRYDLKKTVKKQTGRLHIVELTISPYHTFLDYLFGGCEISFMVSIDFTASNGNPYNVDSLHYCDPTGRPNAYQSAIRAVGQVLEHYDSDKRFPAWGFGGRPIDGDVVSHCFALNGSEYDAEVVGVDGILRAYEQALRHVRLAGPTLFAPSIDMAAAIANQHATQLRQKYFVLLIITDGVITDMDQTISSIVSASSLPLSVMIVGVGDANFSDMEILDADKKKLAAPSGQLAARDIVQFVPMRAVARGANVANFLLAELPSQMLDYMKLKGIVPNTTNPGPVR